MQVSFSSCDVAHPVAYQVIGITLPCVEIQECTGNVLYPKLGTKLSLVMLLFKVNGA